MRRGARVLAAVCIAGCGGGGGSDGGGTPDTLSIGSVTAVPSGGDEAAVTWTTNLPATSRVEYGETPAYGSASPLDEDLVEAHSVHLSGLSPGATYHYRVLSTDAGGASAASGDRTFSNVPGPSIGSCPVFPADNPWNLDISGYPVHPNSDAFIASIGASGGGYLHADFGGDGAYGIPFVTVAGTEPGIPIQWTAYGDESDPGPYPIPLSAPIEGGASSDGDRHAIAVEVDGCMLYELYRAFPRSGYWEADSGAAWDLRSNDLRPLGWTSADAAGLPIFPGLARYEEVAAGEVRHALRVTFSRTQRGYILPATHFASTSTDPDRPPMGLRLRLKAAHDISGFHGQARTILETLKKYGLLVADNGSNWYITGAADPRWDDDDLDQLKTVPGTAFEAVDTGPIRS